MFQPPPLRPEPDLPPDLLLWRRVSTFAPWWAWVLAGSVQLALLLPFWLHSTPAPYHDPYGDVYRGWPVVYGLDQGDVGGDDWGPFVAYFHLDRFALDTVAGIAVGTPLAGLLLWTGRRIRRRETGRAEPYCPPV